MARGRPRAFDRDKALETAMNLFWRKGYDNTSIADLTAALDLKPTSLYAAFQSKEALFGEAVALYVGTAGASIWHHLDDAPTAREAIAASLRASALAFTDETFPCGCMVVLSAPQIEGGNPEVADSLKNRRCEIVALIERRIARGIADGELPPATDSHALASYYACVQFGMSLQARDGASRETLLAIADHAMAAWDAQRAREAVG